MIEGDIRSSKAFSVASVTNGYVYGSTLISLVVIYPLLHQSEFAINISNNNYLCLKNEDEYLRNVRRHEHGRQKRRPLEH